MYLVEDLNVRQSKFIVQYTVYSEEVPEKHLLKLSLVVVESSGTHELEVESHGLSVHFGLRIVSYSPDSAFLAYITILYSQIMFDVKCVCEVCNIQMFHRRT